MDLRAPKPILAAVVAFGFGAMGLLAAACSGPSRGSLALAHLEGDNTLEASSTAGRLPRTPTSVLRHGLVVGNGGRCPTGMADIEGRFCIDRYEGSLVEVLPGGGEQPFSPFAMIEAHEVRAVSAANVYPQGYISAIQAQRACSASGKRLCRVEEWQKACRGPENQTFGYGSQRQPGKCNDIGRSPVVTLYGFRFDSQTMNQPTLNQLPNTLAKTGEHQGCTNGYGVYDMVGNLHEWVADAHGAFYGGFYQDTWQHGDGCSYLTTAHEKRYHDYSTGFRCCAEPAGETPERQLASAEPPKGRGKPASAPKPAKPRKH